MKKVNIKSGVIGLLMGVLLTSGIGAVAVTLTAEQIKYTPSDESFAATNAKEALDEIYKIAEYEIPVDTYFYDSTTTGEDLVRYKKVDGKYYLCDKNGKITNDTEQDVSNLTLVEYKSAASGNIIMGNAAYSDNNFILGENKTEENTIFNFYSAGINQTSYFYFSVKDKSKLTFYLNTTTTTGNIPTGNYLNLYDGKDTSGTLLATFRSGGETIDASEYLEKCTSGYITFFPYAQSSDNARMDVSNIVIE